MSGLETAFHPIRLDESLTARASELGLIVPKVEIADKLQLRLGRTEQTIEVDQEALWAGTQDAELENALLLRVDSLPKTIKTNKPSLTYHSDTHSTLRISPNPTAELGRGRKINTAFWLGILVTDALAEGERANDKGRRLALLHKALPKYAAVVALAILSGAHLGGAVQYPVEAQLGIDAAEFTLLGSAIGAYRKGTMDTTTYLARSKRKQANILAQKYPVLDYGTAVTI